MGVLTVSMCSVTAGLICDRIAAVVDSFNPPQTVTGLSNHLEIQFPEIFAISFLALLSSVFLIAAVLNIYPYNLTPFFETGRSSKRSISSRFDSNYNKNLQPIYNKNNCSKEVEQFQYIFSKLKSVDSQDCLLQNICLANNNGGESKWTNNSTSSYIDQYYQYY